MQDTIIKGDGTSRSLKIPASKAVVYQDVSAMVQDMVSGNFLFDLGPIRLEGVTQKGMDLNKANLLTDATAALYGKGSNASPDEILSAARALITTAQSTAEANNSKILIGSYIGKGLYGLNNANSLTFPFIPKVVIIGAYYYQKGDGSSGKNISLWIVDGHTTTSYKSNVGFRPASSGINDSIYSKKSSDSKTLFWYAENSPTNQLNDSTYVYPYFALG